MKWSIALLTTVALVMIACGGAERETRAITAADPRETTSSEATAAASPRPLTVTVGVPYTGDLPYTGAMTLDVYTPSDPGPWPLVVLFHGGFSPSSEAVADLATAIAERGVVVFAPAWRSAPGSPVSLAKGVEDAACAIRFARAHAGEYGADPSRVVAAGHSGGAYVGAMVALAGNSFTGDCLVEGGSAHVDGFVGLEGPYDFVRWQKDFGSWEAGTPAEWRRLSPLTYADEAEGKVEFLLFVGDGADALAYAETFRDLLAKGGQEAAVVQLPGVSHSRIASADLEQTVAAMVEMASAG